MNPTISSNLASVLPEAAALSATRKARLPWYCYAVALGATSILIGIVWDISWHSTIGRDTFWTPAHMAIHLGGILGGLSCGWLVLRATVGPDSAERAASVRLWGFRGPLGAWVTIWGALAMLTSAPFDNWWHEAYGLDVEILSPPHSVLAAGMYLLVAGALLLLLSEQNRSPAPAGAVPGSRLFLYIGGIMLCMCSIMVTERSLAHQQHAALFYKISAAQYPLLLVGLARASKLRWPATTVALVYTGLTCAAVWILPLFPATPKLAPIYNPVTHMVPPQFPHLLVVPALAIDLWFRWLGRGHGAGRDWLLVVLIALSFVGLFILAQWHFAKFLISPAAENWFFAGNGFWPFYNSRGDHWHRFWRVTEDPLSAQAVGITVALALVSTRLGLWWGNWMARVRR
ncbi:MAG TPA: hypothetical protein VNO52_05400 [Methylomirabilota bacterium]|nr:hypothetical protein [Methylomirabilota bacterium]